MEGGKQSNDKWARAAFCLVLLAEERAILDEWIAWQVAVPPMRLDWLSAPFYSKIFATILAGGLIPIAQVEALGSSALLPRAIHAGSWGSGAEPAEKALSAAQYQVAILEAPFEYSFIISTGVTMLLQVEADGTCTEDGAFLVYLESRPLGSSGCVQGVSVFEHLFDPLPSDTSNTIVITDSVGASTITGYIAAYITETYENPGSIVDVDIEAKSSSNVFFVTLEEGSEKMVLVTGPECTAEGDFALYNSFTLVAMSTCALTGSIGAILTGAGLQKLRIESSLGGPIEVQFAILSIVAYSVDNVIVPFGS